jgi:hypothetical protein
MFLFTLAYTVAVVGLAVRGFARRDL